MSKKTCALVKDIEIKGGAFVPFFVNYIGYPLVQAHYPFNFSLPYSLWRQYGVPLPGLTFPSNNGYAEEMKIYNKIKPDQFVTVYFSAGKSAEAIAAIRALATPGDTTGVDLIVSYNGNVTEILDRTAIPLNAFITSLNTTPKPHVAFVK